MPGSLGEYGLPKGLRRRTVTTVQVAEKPAPKQPAEAKSELATPRDDDVSERYAIPHDPVTGEVVEGEPHPAPHEAGTGPRRADGDLESDRAPQQAPAWLRARAFVGRSTAAQLVIAGGIFGTGLIVYSLLQPEGASVVASVQERRATEAFPKVDLGPPERVTLTEDDINRMLARDVRVAPHPGGVPSVIPFARNQRPAAPEQLPAQRVRSVQPRRPMPMAQDVVSPAPSAPEAPLMISENFYGQGGAIEMAKPTPASARLGLDVGRSIPVSLQVGVSSTHLGIVLAQVTKDTDVRGQRVLARGDVLKGRASSDGERIYIDFYEVATASQTWHLNAYATEGGLPGIIADKRVTGTQSPGRVRVANGAMELLKGAANTAAGAAVGGPGQVVGGVASNMASQTITDMQRDMQPPTGVVLQAVQGKTFDVIVTGD